MTFPKGAIIFLAFTALAGCEREAGVYDLSAADAYQRLAASELPDLIFNQQCGILIHARPKGVPNEKVAWRVTSSGRTMVDLAVTLTPVSESRTKVELAISSEKDGREAYSGDQFYPRPAFNQPLRPAVEEQVAALLEQREYDPKRVPRGTDTVCNVQRAGLEMGRPFRVDDLPRMDARESADARKRRNGRL